MMGKLLYGIIFCVGIPALIMFGSNTLEPFVTIPLPAWPRSVGYAAAGIGFMLMAAGMLALRYRGGGLPMNGYPPVRFVSDGVYALLPHPIYSGAVLLCGGIALLTASRAGFYLFTPLTAAGCITIVWGYERPDLYRRFGRTGNATWFGIPPFNDDAIAPLRRIGAGLFPLLTAWHGVNLPTLLIVHGAVFVWLLTRRTNRSAAVFILGWLTASLAGIGYEWSVGDAGLVFFVPAIDLLILLAGGHILREIYRYTERLSNSWRAWRIGPLRIISHAQFSFLAAAFGFYLAGALTGGDTLIALSVTTVASLLGGALWAQLVEGSARLLRPFGFYGAVFGALAGLGICALRVPGTTLWILFAGLATVAPWTQAIGRLRCMVQGCCHGRPIENPAFADYGVRHDNPSSRVCRFTDYVGRVLHSSQLYSIGLNLPIGGVLMLLWLHRAPAGLIIGLYFALTGMARFIEEAWRGEPQTRRFRGLTEYQWLCLFFELIAFTVWAIPGAMVTVPVPVWHYPFDFSALLIGILYAFAMSMDFPESNRRFSRLTG